MTQEDECLRSPFAILDPSALRRLVALSDDLRLPGAQYSLIASQDRLHTGDKTLRWLVREFRAGEPRPQSPAALEDESEDAG